LYGALDGYVGEQRLYVEGHHDLVVLDIFTGDGGCEVSCVFTVKFELPVRGDKMLAKKADKSYKM